MLRKRRFSSRFEALLCGFCALIFGLGAPFSVGQATEPQSSSQQPSTQQVPTPQQSVPQPGIGQKNPPAKEGKTSATKPATEGEEVASPNKLKLGPLDPAPPPTGLPTNRPVIGLALGGGAALAISEIGTLEWLDEHHIPVDVIAGTSMGSILSALYSTGMPPAQMRQVLDPEEVGRVFRIASAYSQKSFRRREDARELPNGIGVGLKGGPSLRNALLTDVGLNELLDKVFIRYNDQIEFNSLPIPFRCRATDLTEPRSVVFSRGSLQDAVRASASLPGVFQPVEMNGHEYVDGAILDNLPTSDVKDMGAQVIIAFSLPLSPVGKGDLDSIVGVLQRAFSVGIEVNEDRGRKLANVLITPDISGFTATDYSRTADLAERGYAAAEAQKAELMKYALPPDEWEAYMAARRAKERPAVGPVLQVKVKAPTPEVTKAVYKKFNPMVNQPVDTNKIQSLLAEIRADGRYNADYTVGYDSGSNRPILLIDVEDKKTGPPFLDVGFNVQAQTAGVTRATFDTIFVYQDLGGYGSELRGKLDFGFFTRLEGEYFHRFMPTGFFVAPRANLIRQPFYIYASPDSDTRVSERQSQFGGFAADIGWTDAKRQELRAGWAFNNVQWHLDTGQDNLPDYDGNSQTARIRYVFDSQDRALVPHYGLRLTSSFGYLYDTVNSPSAPQFYTQISGAHTWSTKNIFAAKVEGGTMFDRNVAEPFRFTLGGPLRLAAESTDQLRGTDYWLVAPGYLRKIFSLNPPLGGGLYAWGTFEAGQMRAPNQMTVTREDVYFGAMMESPLGVVTIGPAIGFNGDHKFLFTIGRFF